MIANATGMKQMQEKAVHTRINKRTAMRCPGVMDIIILRRTLSHGNDVREIPYHDTDDNGAKDRKTDEYR